MRKTTYGEVSALATSLAFARGDRVMVDANDVRTFMQLKGAPDDVRGQFLSDAQARYIDEAITFLLSDDAPRA